jgi:hypothetical protein
MADNKNILIGLLIVVVILLAFLAFRQMTYSPAYSSGYYQPWQMGPGMMYGPGYGYGYGPGMMYGYGPGYSSNITGSQAGYGPGYWIGPGVMYGNGPSNSTSIADELSKLDALKKEGAISQDEYNKLKNRLID